MLLFFTFNVRSGEKIVRSLYRIFPPARTFNNVMKKKILISINDFYEILKWTYIFILFYCTFLFLRPYFCRLFGDFLLQNMTLLFTARALQRTFFLCLPSIANLVKQLLIFIIKVIIHFMNSYAELYYKLPNVSF